MENYERLIYDTIPGDTPRAKYGRNAMNDQDATRAAGSSAPDCSASFSYIPGWHVQVMKCACCGTKRSVKYRLADGRTVCVLCVTKPNTQAQLRSEAT